MYAAPPPPPLPGHHHRPPAVHRHYYPYTGPGYVTPGYGGGNLTCVEIPNPVAAATPPYVWVNPITGAACEPYLPIPVLPGVL
jgi:hypothetical protein